ncbi:hypothetical protein GN956_G15300 [Arapaima gigas]
MVSTQNSKVLAGMNGSRTHRYRPASEVDDDTLARKREYWRKKKREQRAKLSALKKENNDVRKPAVFTSVLAASEPIKSVMFIPRLSPAHTQEDSQGFITTYDGLAEPTLLNSDGSYQTLSSGPPSLFSSVCGVSEEHKGSDNFLAEIQKDWKNANVMTTDSTEQGVAHHDLPSDNAHFTITNQTERWFQRTKLQKVLPQFHDACSESLNDLNSTDDSKEVAKYLMGDVKDGTFYSAKPNGAFFNSCSQVPAAQVQPQSNSSLQSQVQNDAVLLNGSSSFVLSEYHAESHVASGHCSTKITHMNIQPRNTSVRSVTPGVSTGEKICGDSSGPVTNQTSKTKSTIMPTVVGESICVRESSKAKGSRQISRRRATFETEEEKAARQREYWRLKKREQRAKLTGNLVKAREKTRTMTTALLKNEQSSCIVLERPPSAWCKERQRQPNSRARTPLTHVSLQRASRLLKNAKAVAVSSSAPRYSSTVVQASPCQSFPVLGNLPISNDNQLALPTKTEKLCENASLKGVSAIHIPRSSVKLNATLMHEAPVQISETCLHSPKLQDGVDRRGVIRSRSQRQRFLRNPSQRNTIKFSPAASLIPIPGQRGEETTEEKMARKREYWRIKKREQRAKLSAEVKAKMKERDALMRRIKRYQSILEEMRKARAGTGLRDKTLPPQETVFTSDTDAIGGFIKEDGTVTTEIPQVSKDLRLSGPEAISEIQSLCNVPVTSDVSTSIDLIRQVQVNVPPSFDSTSQVKESSQFIVTSPLGSSELVPSKVKQVSRNIPKNIQYTPSFPKTRALFRYPQNVRNTYPKITLVKPKSNSLQITKVLESCSSAGIKERSGLVTCPLGPRASNVVPSQTMQLTEEERMAKKREYWRIKKREQRAKCSARRSQTLSHYKHSILLPRQQNLKASLSRRTTMLGFSKSTPTSTRLWKLDTQSSIPSQGNKPESESAPAADDQCPSTDPTLCEDVKPLLLPPPQQQVESDPAQSMDTQETTLLAVASMKKLLEESLSTVLNSDGLSSCSNEPIPCKDEENVPDLDIKPSLPCFPAASEEATPPAKSQHDILTSSQEYPEVRHWDSEVGRSIDFSSCQISTDVSSTFNGPLSGHLFCQTSSTPPSSTQTLLDSVSCSETAAQTLACTHMPPTSNQPLPLPRALRPNLKKPHQCYSPEPSKKIQASSQPEEDILQKRREYWRMMKREQRARKAAREKEMKRQTGSVKNITHQIPVSPEEHPCWRGRRREQMGRKVAQSEVMREKGPTWACKPLHPPRVAPETVEQQEPNQRPEVNGLQSAPLQCVLPSAGSALTCLQTIPTLPTLLVVSSTPCSTSLSTGSFHIQPNVPETCPIKDKKQEDAAPDPAEPSKPMLTSAQLEEDRRRKKREYWRGRKREQRARKAARDREMKQASRVSQLNLPIRKEPKKLEQQEHHSSQWINCTEETDPHDSPSSTNDLGLQPLLSHTGGVKGDVQVDVTGKDDEVEEGGHMGLSTSADTWKSHFLMDYEPLNQLLVCMVCGELQHSLTLEGVRAHIEEAHPDTLSLAPCERQRIQEAWDEQVSVRERFYSSQLQQQGPYMGGGVVVFSGYCNGGPAEVEVLVDLEDFTDVKNGKLSKSKGAKVKKSFEAQVRR